MYNSNPVVDVHQSSWPKGWYWWGGCQHFILHVVGTGLASSLRRCCLNAKLDMRAKEIRRLSKDSIIL